MDASAFRISRVPPTASARRNHSANRSRASTDAPEALVSHPVDDNWAYLLIEEAEAKEGSIPGAPEDPSLLLNFNTHIATAIWK